MEKADTVVPIKVLDRFKVPLFEVELPSVELPDFPPKVPKLDDRQMEIAKHAVLEDLGDLIPIIGDFLADLHYERERHLMTEEEYEQFLENNKWLPSSLAVLKTFMEVGK